MSAGAAAALAEAAAAPAADADAPSVAASSASAPSAAAPRRGLPADAKDEAPAAPPPAAKSEVGDAPAASAAPASDVAEPTADAAPKSPRGDTEPLPNDIVQYWYCEQCPLAGLCTPQSWNSPKCKKCGTYDGEEKCRAKVTDHLLRSGNHGIKKENALEKARQAKIVHWTGTWNAFKNSWDGEGGVVPLDTELDAEDAANTERHPDLKEQAAGFAADRAKRKAHHEDLRRQLEAKMDDARKASHPPKKSSGQVLAKEALRGFGREDRERYGDRQQQDTPIGARTRESCSASSTARGPQEVNPQWRLSSAGAHRDTRSRTPLPRRPHGHSPRRDAPEGMDTELSARERSLVSAASEHVVHCLQSAAPKAGAGAPLALTSGTASGHLALQQESTVVGVRRIALLGMVEAARNTLRTAQYAERLANSAATSFRDQAEHAATHLAILQAACDEAELFCLGENT